MAEVRSVRRLMKQKGISKTPDFSLIRVDGDEEESSELQIIVAPTTETQAPESSGTVEEKAQGGEDGDFNIERRCLDQDGDFSIDIDHQQNKIYGPNIKFDRVPALAFNVFDWKYEKVEPVLMQKLVDRSNISLSYGFPHHIWFVDKYTEEKGRVLQTKEGRGQGVTSNKKKDKDKQGVTVVTAALSFLENFEDVYKLWGFIARFLDAGFVEKEVEIHNT
ncbi:hypothetical protein RJT34_25075 [Clitoria ternatea]|uniref:Uncharacterized protein n=1 Tax=Clitoria ternatea TaxID=43366 RepID=A0AAN9IGI8_CLITE